VRARHRATRAVPALIIISAGLAATLTLLWFTHPAFAPVVDCITCASAGWLACGYPPFGAFVLWRARPPHFGPQRGRDGCCAGNSQPTGNTRRPLHDATDPLARAQRAETEQFLRQTNLTRHHYWLPAMSVLATLLAVAHLATLICWARPVEPDSTAKAKS